MASVVVGVAFICSASYYVYMYGKAKRLERVHSKMHRYLHFDLAKAKIIWVTTTIISTVPSTVEIVFPEPVGEGSTPQTHLHHHPVSPPPTLPDRRSPSIVRSEHSSSGTHSSRSVAITCTATLPPPPLPAFF